jgi:hypothetical protein
MGTIVLGIVLGGLFLLGGGSIALLSLAAMGMSPTGQPPTGIRISFWGGLTMAVLGCFVIWAVL